MKCDGLLSTEQCGLVAEDLLQYNSVQLDEANLIITEPPVEKRSRQWADTSNLFLSKLWWGTYRGFGTNFKVLCR